MNPFLGEIKMFGGNFAPRDWALCDGQLMSIAQNQALFSLLGTTYGGDGRTTFALPDLRGRVAMHAGTGPGLTTRRLGARFGTETNVLNQTQLPVHNHTANATVQVQVAVGGKNGAANKGKVGGNILATNTAGSSYSDETPDAQLGGVSAAGTADVTIYNAGNSSPVNNIQPSEVVNYIIAIQGVYPSRS